VRRDILEETDGPMLLEERYEIFRKAG